jgi:hypothetical protein
LPVLGPVKKWTAGVIAIVRELRRRICDFLSRKASSLSGSGEIIMHPTVVANEDYIAITHATP